MRRKAKAAGEGIKRAQRRAARAGAFMTLFVAGLACAGLFATVVVASGTSTGSTDTQATSSAATSTDTTATTTTDTSTTTGSTTTTTSQAFAPSISTDASDYPPGGTVTLTGANWLPGESVHIFANDTIGQTWSYSTDVTADATGNFTLQFQLSTSFVSNYTVTATGAPGESASTSFTDGNLTSVSGTVTDSTTHVALAGVTVTCDTTGGCNNTFTTTTDASGNYSFSGASKLSFSGNGPTTLTLKFSKSGYVTGTITLNNVNNGNSFSNEDIALALACTNASVTASPSNVSITYGANASFTATGGGSPTPTEQWQVSTDNGTTFTNISGATSPTLTLTKPAVSSSGNEYRAVFTNTCNGTQTATSTAATLTVARKAITVTPDSGQSKVYGTSDPTLTFTNSPALESGDSFSGALSRVAGENVGSYAITLGTLSAGNNYTVSLSGTTVNFAINRAQLSVNAVASQKTYGDADPTLTATLSGFKNGENAGTANVTGTASCTRVAGESVANSPYTITCTAGTLAAPNYGFASGTTANFAITPRDLSVTPDSGQSKVYGAVDPVLTYSHGTLYNGDTSSVFSGALARAAGETVAGGPYAISQGTLSAGGNYHVVFTSGVTFAITPRDLSVTPDAGQFKVYGAADPALTYTHGTLYNGDTNSVFSGALSRDPGESVAGGPYAITLGSLSAGANYHIVFTSGITFVITPRHVSVTPDSGQSKVYGDSDPALTYTHGTLYNGDTSSVFSGALSRDPGESVAGGPYAITLGTLSAGSNYVIDFTSGVTFAITPRDLSVTPFAGQSKVYGQADPTAFSFMHGPLFNSDPETIFTGALSRVAGEHVGNYAITLGTLSAGSNYHIVFTSGVTFAITPRDLTVTPDSGQSKVYGAADPGLTYTHGQLYNGDTSSVFSGALSRVAGESVAGGPYAITQGTLSAGNDYAIQFTTGVTFAITPRDLAVTPDSGQSKVYGDSDPALTYTHGTLYNGDTSSVFSGALSRVAGETVAGGPYAITQGTLAAGSNYNIVFTSGVTFAITPRDLSVTPDSGQSKVYGDPDPALTYTHGTLYNGDGNSVFTGALARAAGETVAGGPYAITQGSLSAGSNYNVVFTSGVTFAITPRDLSVTPFAGQSKVYGQADPTAFSYMHGPLYNSDPETVLTGALSRVAGEHVGNYAITQGTLSAGSNYHIVFTSSVSFGITPRSLTVTPNAGQSKVYGDPDPGLTYTHGQLYNGDTDSVFTGALTRAAGSTVASGPYAITQGTLSAGNDYAIQFTTGVTFAITPRSLTVTPTAGQSKVYGNPDPALTYTHGTLYNGDTDSVFTGALTRAAGESVAGGPYAITQGTLAAGTNYNVVFTSGVTFAITPRPITVTADNKTKVLNAPDPALTYSVTTGNLVGSDGFSGALTRDPGETIGSYAIRQGTLTAGTNYAIAFVPGTLKIIYATGGTCNGDANHSILQPINADGSSVFKQGSTVPAKFRVCDANGNSVGTAGVVKSFALTGSSTDPSALLNESVDSTTPDTAFRWDSTGQQWIFNMSTKSLKAGTKYTYTVTLNDNSTIVFTFALK